MSTFTVTRLAGQRAVIAGTDQFGTTNKVVVDTQQWDEIAGHDQYSKAEADFEAAVEAFFEPLTKAAARLEESIERPSDSNSYVVLQEAQPAQAEQQQVLVHLSHDSQVLRLAEAGDYDRLMWVGDTLEILEVLPGTNVDTAVETVQAELGATDVPADADLS